MTSNDHIKELIIRYFEKEISEDGLKELEQWIHGKGENKNLFFELKKLYDSQNLPTYLKGRSYDAQWDSLYEKIHAGSTVSRKAGVNRFPVICLRYTAIAVIAVCTGFGINELSRKVILEPPVTFNEITVKKGGKANLIILSDGSEVMLNSATHFKYPTEFGKDKREVYLDGEAYFKVVKNDEKPFIIKLNRQEITVLGTLFNVLAYKEDPYSITSLIEGKILLESFDEKGKKMSRMYLNAGEQTYADNTTGSVFINKVNTTTIANSWIDGKYRFKDEKLSTIVRRLENLYGITIRIESETLKNIRYTGTFSLDQKINDVLKVINSEKQFNYQIINDEIILSAMK
jgi:ferric-dicitrate binding protein FerR (iron transport regulator)